MKIKYDLDIMRFISLFESLTGAKVKDCMQGEKLTFVVDAGQMGLAIGKQGKNLQRVEKTFKKEIQLYEFSEDPVEFFKAIVAPLRKFEVSYADKKIIVKGEDTKTKGLLIGRGRANLERHLAFMKRYFDIETIEVV